MSNEAIGQQFEVWQDGELDGYLLQITAQICQHQEGDEYVLDEILDVAGNKGTGKWTVGSALDLGVPVPSLSAALFSRYISAFKDFRLLGSAAYEEGFKIEIEDKEEVLAHLEKALIACKMVSYAQGFHLLSAASDRYNWGLSLKDICKTWRAGCIIRSVMLEHFIQAFSEDIGHLLLDATVAELVTNGINSAKHIQQYSRITSIAMPTLSASLEYFLSFRSAELPTNMIQAQRDFFGAHTYERRNSERGKFFHTQWE